MSDFYAVNHHLGHKQPLVDSSIVSSHMLALSEADYKVYPFRWVILLLYSSLSITNAVLWISFAPISSLTCDYYSISKTEVNTLSIMFMVLYLPGSLLATYVFHRFGLRWGVVLGALLNTVGALLRFLSAEDNQHPRSHGLVLLMLGQALAGLGQPMFTNVPAKLAAAWFSVKQRDLATTIGSMFNPIGIAVGQILPTVMVSKSGGMWNLLLVELALALVTATASILFFRSAPPTPPSRSSAARDQLHQDQQQQHLLSPSSSMSSSSSASLFAPIINDIKNVLADPQFRLLLIGFGMGLGMFNALTTLIEQIIQPSGYGDNEAGIFGALIIGFGLLGAAVMGPIMDKTHAYNTLLKVGFAGAIAGLIFFFLSLRPNMKVLLAIASSFMGFCMIPLLPVAFECGVECTYPVHEETSSGLLMLSGNIAGMGLIYLLEYLIDLKPHYTTVFVPSSLFMVAMMLLALGVILFYKGPYKRLYAERSEDVIEKL